MLEILELFFFIFQNNVLLFQKNSVLLFQLGMSEIVMTAVAI